MSENWQSLTGKQHAVPILHTQLQLHPTDITGITDAAHLQYAGVPAIRTS